MSTEQHVEAQLGTHNGQQPTPALSEEWQRIEQAYREIQRRDESAEYRAWREHREKLVLAALLVVALGVLLWQYTHAHTVQAFVQVVQVDEKGRLVQLGVPEDILAYTPDEGLWMDMLREWVIKARWRSEDKKALPRREWAWVYRHTCGPARRMLETLEEQEKPFDEKSKKVVSVELKSITKTVTPESYQVLWTETSLDPAQPTPKTTQWTGTFTVGRYRPPTAADALDNRLGLCVTSYDLSLQP